MDLILQYYAVLYIDVLNQRESLNKIKDIPRNETERKLVINNIRNSFGVLERVKNGIIGYMESSNKISDEYTAEEQNILRKMHGDKLCLQQIGDAFIIYFPLGENKEKISVVGLQKILFCAAISMLSSLGKGIPIRGSLVVDIGMEVSPGNIYGPVLVKAYDLETNLAQWPRIVVDRSVVQYIGFNDLPSQGIIPRNPQEELRASIAINCDSLITRDVDGNFCINYIGKFVKDFHKNDLEFFELVSLCKNFLTKEYNRFASDAPSSIASSKLAARYKNCLYFIESCLQNPV